MGVKEVISNPYVIGGGVLLGLVVLLAGGGGGKGQSSNGDVANTNAATLGYLAAQNATGMDYAYKNAALAVDRAKSNDINNTNIVLAFMSTLSNMHDVDANTAVQMRAVNGDIAKTRITAEASRQIEADANYTRLMQTYVGADESKYGMDTQLKLQKADDFKQLSVAGMTTTASSRPGIESVLNTGLSLIPKLFGKA